MQWGVPPLAGDEAYWGAPASEESGAMRDQDCSGELLADPGSICRGSARRPQNEASAASAFAMTGGGWRTVSWYQAFRR